MTPEVVDKNFPEFWDLFLAAKAAGYLPDETILRQVKYLNNGVEGDHMPMKRLIAPGAVRLRLAEILNESIGDARLLCNWR